MNKLTSYTFIAIFVLLLTACGGKNTYTDNRHLISYDPEYAKGYTIAETAEGSTVINVVNPWQGAEKVSSGLLITRNGQKAPEKFTGSVLADSAKRIVAMSSTHVAILEALGCADRIVGVSGIDYISSPYIQSHREQIKDVGYEGNVDYELLISLRPDIVLIYGVNSASPMEKKLKELKIPFMYVGDYLEDSPIGKAEWMVPLAEITGNRDKGIEYFNRSKEAYNELASAIGDSLKSGAISTSRVMINTPYGDVWYIPSGESYMSRLVADAGGELPLSGNKSTASATIDMEKAYSLAADCDVWINVENAASANALKRNLPRFASVPAVKSGRVYANNLRSTPGGGNDFYESGIVNPHLILRDLVNIIHPSLLGDSVLHYYRKLN